MSMKGEGVGKKCNGKAENKFGQHKELCHYNGHLCSVIEFSIARA